MFRRLTIICAAVAMCCASALAQGRPDARTMSCEQVRGLIHANGAVVLTTGRITYDRYVAHGGFCMHLEQAVPARIQTRDTDRCVVFRCQEVIHDDRGGFWQN